MLDAAPDAEVLDAAPDAEVLDAPGGAPPIPPAPPVPPDAEVLDAAPDAEVLDAPGGAPPIPPVPPVPPPLVLSHPSVIAGAASKTTPQVTNRTPFGQGMHSLLCQPAATFTLRSLREPPGRPPVAAH